MAEESSEKVTKAVLREENISLKDIVHSLEQTRDNLKRENGLLVARVEESESALETLRQDVADAEMDDGEEDSEDIKGEPLSYAVAAWLTIVSGKKVRPIEIISAELAVDKVVYRRKGSPNTMGIAVKEHNHPELVDPPPHECEFRVRVDGQKPNCMCGMESSKTN